MIRASSLRFLLLIFVLDKLSLCWSESLGRIADNIRSLYSFLSFLDGQDLSDSLEGPSKLGLSLRDLGPL